MLPKASGSASMRTWIWSGAASGATMEQDPPEGVAAHQPYRAPKCVLGCGALRELHTHCTPIWVAGSLRVGSKCSNPLWPEVACLLTRAKCRAPHAGWRSALRTSSLFGSWGTAALLRWALSGACWFAFFGWGLLGVWLVASQPLVSRLTPCSLLRAPVQVVEVRHKATGRVYALKAVDKHLVLRHKQANYIRAERALLDRLAHPGIVRLRFTFQDAASLYLGLDLCPNGARWASD